jgi:hypothetical protein
LYALYLAYQLGVGWLIPSTLAVDLVALVQKVKPAIVEVLTYDEHGNPVGIATGFFLNNYGRIRNFELSDPLFYREIQFSRLGGTLPEKVDSFAVKPFEFGGSVYYS